MSNSKKQHSEKDLLKGLKDKIIAEYLFNWPFITDKDIETTLSKLNLTEEQGRYLRGSLHEDSLKAIKSLNSIFNYSTPLKYISLILMSLFSSSLLFSIMDINSLSICISFLAVIYWVYLIFIAKLGLIDSIYFSFNSKIISNITLDISYLYVTNEVKDIQNSLDSQKARLKLIEFKKQKLNQEAQESIQEIKESIQENQLKVKDILDKRKDALIHLLFAALLWSIFYFIPPGIFIYFGKYSQLSLIIAFGWLLYVPLLLIPQIVCSHLLTLPKYPHVLVKWLENKTIEEKEIVRTLAKSYQEGYYGTHKGDNTKDVSTKTLMDTMPADNLHRRYYADALLPKIPAHVFFLGLSAYFLAHIFSLNTIEIPIISFPLSMSTILIMAFAVAPFIVFIDIPFWIGQRQWKIMVLVKLRHNYSAVNDKICSSSGENAAIDNSSLDSLINISKFYYDQIDYVLKYSMHPYDFEASIWIFVVGIMSSIMSNYIGSLLFPNTSP